MKRLFALAALLASIACAPVFAQSVTQHPIDCAPGVPCANDGPAATGTGDNAPTMASKINQDIGAIITALGSVSASAMPALTGDTTTSAGSVNTTTSSTGGVPFAPSATTDATNASNLSSGTVPLARLAGMSSRSVNSGTMALVSSDNAQLVYANEGSSAVAATLPQIGTSGIAAGSYQVLLINLGTGTITVTPSTSTIAGAATATIASGQSALIAADSTGTNYSIAWFGVNYPMSAANLTGGTMSGATALINGAVIQGTGLSPTSATCAGNRVNLPASNTIGFCESATEVAQVNAAGGLTSLAGVPTITSISNCTSFGTVTGDASGFEFSLTVSSGVCSFHVTWPVAAPNIGWICSGTELNQGTTIFQLALSSTVLSNFKTGATTAGGDVIAMQCSPH